jgi:hypothetical protein
MRRIRLLPRAATVGKSTRGSCQTFDLVWYGGFRMSRRLLYARTGEDRANAWFDDRCRHHRSRTSGVGWPYRTGTIPSRGDVDLDGHERVCAWRDRRSVSSWRRTGVARGESSDQIGVCGIAVRAAVFDGSLRHARSGRGGSCRSCGVKEPSWFRAGRQGPAARHGCGYSTTPATMKPTTGWRNCGTGINRLALTRGSH